MYVDFDTLLTFVKKTHDLAKRVCESDPNMTLFAFSTYFPFSLQLEIKQWHQKIR